MNFPPFLYEAGVKGHAGSLIERVAFKSATLSFTAANQQALTPRVPLDKVQVIEAVKSEITNDGAETFTATWELLDAQNARRFIGACGVATLVVGPPTFRVATASLIDHQGPLVLLPNWLLKVSLTFTGAVDNKTFIMHAHGWTFPRGTIGDAL